MGKRLISQRRGSGSTTYRSPGHRFVGKAALPTMMCQGDGVVRDLIKCPAHSAPLAIVEYNSGELALMIAPEGVRVSDKVASGSSVFESGHVVRLGDAPEGTSIFNIESVPGDGGKFVRSSGTFAKVVAHLPGKVVVLLPSKKKKDFHPNCRATVGVVAGSGRLDKPLVKAGNMYHRMRARNKLYPRTSGVAMNAVDHPFGGSDGSKPGPTIAPRYAPAGANVGKLHPRRTGRKQR